MCPDVFVLFFFSHLQEIHLCHLPFFFFQMYLISNVLGMRCLALSK